LLKGSAYDITVTTISSFAGVFFAASGLQGYVMGGGRADGLLGWLGRGLLVSAGILCALAGIPQIGFTHLVTTLMGLVVGIGGILVVRASQRPIDDRVPATS
jgi:hypothetical protein